MKEMTTESLTSEKKTVESPGIAWLLATFFLILVIFLPFLVT